MKYLILILVFQTTFCFSQKKIGVGIGNSVKNKVGTTLFLVDYSPKRWVDLYVAPSWGVFTGGLSVFVGAKVNFALEKKMFFSLDIAYRNVFKHLVSFENDNTISQETYEIPESKFIYSGVGLNYRLKNLNILYLSFNYSVGINNNTPVFISGPYSNRGIESANNRVNGGIGFTLLYKGKLDSFTNQK